MERIVADVSIIEAPTPGEFWKDSRVLRRKLFRVDDGAIERTWGQDRWGAIINDRDDVRDCPSMVDAQHRISGRSLMVVEAVAVALLIVKTIRAFERIRAFLDDRGEH